MRGYGQFCPVALGSEVFAERWTPLILRELLAGSHRFSQLQRGLPGIPRALLAQRLGSLLRAGLIERRPTRAGRGFEYHLSPAGVSFRPVVETLGRWGYQWAAEQLRPDNLDAGLLMWFLRRRVRVDLCLADPGFDTDLYVTTDVRTFTQVFLGQVTLHRAKGCRTRTFGAGQTFLEFGRNDVNLVLQPHLRWAPAGAYTRGSPHSIW
jgi:DNA-binding HxlR family transcriptional regulator